jgi:hypothetical protein
MPPASRAPSPQCETKPPGLQAFSTTDLSFASEREVNWSRQEQKTLQTRGNFQRRANGQSWTKRGFGRNSQRSAESKKCLLQGFYGRGGFRTCDLSRVKRPGKRPRKRKKRL